MDPLIEVIEYLALFVAGLAVHALAAAAVLIVLAMPILLVLGGIEGAARLRGRLFGVTRVGTMLWRPGLYYAPGHTWIQALRGQMLRVGLDDLAQRLLPVRARIGLPRPGDVVRRGEPVTIVRANGHETWIPAPVSGTVTAVNHAVERDPSLVHRDPYVRGWLFQIAATDNAHEELLRAEPARRWFAGETVRLEHMLERGLGHAAADGSKLLLPAHELPESGCWRGVTDAFLHAS
jgi:glycine cleavage system H lipoate-binding protein